MFLMERPYILEKMSVYFRKDVRTFHEKRPYFLCEKYILFYRKLIFL